MSQIPPPELKTPSERYVKQLADRSFLSLWSYANVYRNQGSGGGAANRKEICDLLVVFENHILIFSVKEYQFGGSGNIKLDWDRWFRKAVVKSAEQIWGAERWLKQHPNRIFLDANCTIPFPIALPQPDNMIVHRIVVALGASERCRDLYGGSGSLMLQSDLEGNNHFAATGGEPFVIGQVNFAKGFVHVLDNTSLDIVLQTLDTITDFITYLDKKESFFNPRVSIRAAGEEELLALYLMNTNERDEHDFVLPIEGEFAGLALSEGFWELFQAHPQRLEQIQDNKISYAWDNLIETFSEHAIKGTEYFATEPGVIGAEKILRYMARESRFRRRYIVRRMLELAERSNVDPAAVRLLEPETERDPCYVFLILTRPMNIPYEEYRETRRELLYAYCRVAKLRVRKARHVVGLAFDPPNQKYGSQDGVYLNVEQWGKEEEREAKTIQRKLGLLTSVNRSRAYETEYPNIDLETNQRLRVQQPKIPRNALCPCGSGKKYKHCCLRKK